MMAFEVIGLLVIGYILMVLCALALVFAVAIAGFIRIILRLWK